MAEIQIQRIGRNMAEIRIEGSAPLIVNRFSQKARDEMAERQQGKARAREPKNPEACFEASLYRLPEPDSYGVPATGFKGAIVDAARYFKGSKLTMTALKQMIFVKGVGSDMLVPLEAGPPKMREDPVRNATGVADLRYRGEFWPWAANLQIVYLRGMFDISSLIALVDAAGMGGICEWRPSSKESKTGMFGTWSVPDQDVKEIQL